MRRLLCTLLGLPVLLIAQASVSAAVFPTDIHGHRYEAAISDLWVRGIIEGYADGTYRANSPINRAEMLKILIEARYPDAADPADLRCFVDFERQVPQWYARPACLARELGIVGGYPDRTFRPERQVNLAEALKMALLTFDIRPAPAQSGPWYEPYLELARDRDILIGLLKSPGHLLTRGEMASIVSILLPDALPTGPATCGNGAIESPEQCDDGNTENSDGCSKICILVPEPVRHPILNIDQNTAGTLTTIAQGQKGVTLLRFTAVIGRQDGYLTRVAFAPSIGSLSYAQHYRLAMDRDNDGTFETIVQAEGRASKDRVIFDELNGGDGVLLPEEISVRFEVRADLASSLGPVTIGLMFATDDPDYVSARGAVDGYVLTGIETDNVCTDPSVCWIRVNTQASTDVNIKDRANLFVTADSTPVTNHQLLGGTVSPPLLRIKLRADGEDIDLRNLRIDGGSNSVESLFLYRLNPGQTFSENMQPFAQATNGQCPSVTATRFCANLSLSMLTVSPLADAVIVVAAKMKNDQLGAVSGQSFALSLTGSTGDDHALEARGKSSMQQLDQNDGDGQGEGEIFIGTITPGANSSITAATNDVVLSRIGEITNGRSSSSQTGIPSGLSTFSAFKITALPHTNTLQGSNDVIIHTLLIHITAQNVQIDPLSYSLRNPENPSALLACSASASTGSFDVTCSGINSSDIQSRIPQGDDAIYELRANITNTQLSPGTSLLVSELVTLGQRSQTNSVTWNDDATTFTWVDVPSQSIASTIYRSQ